MAAPIFEWDDENIEHIALHNVEIHETEAVFDNKPLIVRVQEANISHLAKPTKVVTSWSCLVASLAELA